MSETRGWGYERDKRAVDGVGMGRLTARRPAQHLAAEAVVTRPETLAVEERLEVRVKGAPLTVTMCTPGSDVELAQSFYLLKGLIAHRDDVITVRYCRGAHVDAPTPTRLLDEDEPIILTNLFGKMSKTPEQ